MRENTRHIWGDMILFSVAIIWGLGFIAVKIGLEDGMAPFFLMFLRFGIASIALIPLVYRKIIIKSERFKSHTIKNGALLGVFTFLGFAFQTIGLNYTTTSNNAFLTGVNVVIVPFLAFVITKKPIQLKAVIAAFMTLIGIGVLTLDQALTTNIGDLLTLICALLFAFHITITGIVASKESSKDLVFIQMATAFSLSLIASFIFRESYHVTPKSSVAILYLGMFSTMLAFVLQTVGQRYAHSAQAAMILSTESLFGPIFAIILLGDPLNLRIVLGGIIIFSAIFLSESGLRFRNKPLIIRKPSTKSDTL